MRRMMASVCAVLAAILLWSCSDASFHEEHRTVDRGGWNYTDTLTFQVPVDEPTDSLLLSIYTRHTVDFGWRNAWVRIVSVAPGGDTARARYDLKLSQPSGEWYGRCRGDVCQLTQPVDYPIELADTGIYVFHLLQDMRVDPLTDVLAMGIRLDRTPPDELD